MNAAQTPQLITPPAADDPRAIGRYRVLGRLGSGGMGEVFLGLSPGRRLVAVKVVHAHLARDPEFRQRFAREVAAARAVGGFHTPAVVDADVTGVQPWCASEYIAAPALDEVVTKYGPLPVDSVWELARGVAEALQAIHAARIVHRDLKPSNVLIAGDGPRVIDFGIAQSLGDGATVTVTGGVIGTPGYMSPEQARGGFVGPAGDVFSLGSVLMFAACGRGPFGTGDAAALLMRVAHGEPDLSGLPPGTLGDLVAQCLSAEPAARPRPADLLAVLNRERRAETAQWLPADVAAVTGAYTREIADLTLQATTDLPEFAPRRRNRVMIVLAAVAAVLLVVAGGLTYTTLRDTERSSATASSTASPITSAPRAQRIPVGVDPHFVTLSADGTQLFAVGTKSVQFLDAKTNAVTRTIKVDLAVFEEAIVSPDGRRIYAPSLARKVIRILDATTGNEIGTLGPVDSPKRPDVSPDSRLVYVPDGANLSIFDAETKSRVGPPIPLGQAPGKTQPLPDGSKLYIAAYSLMNQPKNDISVYHPATGAVTTIDVGVRTRDLAISANGARAAVTTWRNNRVFLIDTATDTVTGTVDLTSPTSGAALSPDGARAYIASEDTATVMVIDTAKAAVIDQIRVEQQPNGLTMSPDGHLYIANSGSNSISVVPTA